MGRWRVRILLPRPLWLEGPVEASDAAEAAALFQAQAREAVGAAAVSGARRLEVRSVDDGAVV